MITQERSELLRLCLAKIPGWHTCEEGCHVPCEACEHPESVQRMSTQELADYIESWNHAPDCLSVVIDYDTYLGFNVCRECGAHETTGGWQQRERRREPRITEQTFSRTGTDDVV